MENYLLLVTTAIVGMLYVLNGRFIFFCSQLLTALFNKELF